jgi:hypothetical protein
LFRDSTASKDLITYPIYYLFISMRSRPWEAVEPACHAKRKCLSGERRRELVARLGTAGRRATIHPEALGFGAEPKKTPIPKRVAFHAGTK